MTVQTDPLDPCWVDEADGASATLPLAEATNGFGSGQNFHHTKGNAIFRSAAEWKVWLDQGKLPVEQGIGTTSCLLSVDEFEYTTGGGLTESIANETALLVLGRYVSMTEDRLTARGQADLIDYTFTASKDHHFYISADGLIEVDIVTIGVSPSPGAGQVWLYTGRTNATDLILQTYGTAFAEQRLVVDIPWQFSDVLKIADSSGGTNYARLWLGTNDDSTEGWYLETQANGANLRLFELNSLNQQVIDFGDASNPVTISRDVDIDTGSLSVAEDLTVGDGQTQTASTLGWYRVGTHNAGETDQDTWGKLTATKTLKEAADNGTRTITAPNLADGVYAGVVRLVGVRSDGPSSTNCYFEYNAFVRVSGGTATAVSSGGLYIDDNIGLSGVTLGVSGAAPKVDVAIPNLGGIELNFTASWNFDRVDTST